MDVSFESLDGCDFGVCVRPRRDTLSLEDWLLAEKDAVAQALSDFGFIAFRGFKVESAAAFDRVAASLSNAPLNYLYRSTPRTALTGRIYTASEYPADQEIPLHNENSYQRSWPLKIAFCCVTPARSGGETTLADMRRVTRDLPAELFRKFGDLGVRYVRNYRPYVDLPWQVVFQTEDPAAVTRYCNEARISATWLDRETLHTEQTCQGVAQHPATGETLFFNQAHLFHVSNIGKEDAQIMLESFGLEGVPRNSIFGDGSAIGERELAAVRNAFARNAQNFSWRTGDVLLLDNMRVAHGRRPYRGERVLLTSLLHAHSPELRQ